MFKQLVSLLCLCVMGIMKCLHLSTRLGYY